MNKKAKKKVLKEFEVGAGVAAGLAGTLIGAYLLSGKKNQKKVKDWVAKARKEIAENVKKAKNVGEKEYKIIVERAMKKYGALHDISLKEMMLAIADAKNEWRKISAENKKVVKKVVKKAPVKKVVKKVIKKK